MPETTKAPEKVSEGHKLGLPQAIALIMGGIIGTGIFGLPAQVAQFGMMAIVTLVIVTIGAMALALTFGSLVKRIPAAGGPYAYARYYFGDAAGFSAAWPYWITAWAGNAGIVVVWVIYVQALFGLDPNDKFLAILIAMAGLWIPALVNLSGLKHMGSFQLVTTILKFIPIVFIATVGLVIALTRRNFPEFNPSGGSWFDAMSLSAAIVLFSYLGVELASVAAAKIKNPDRNVPIATVLGTAACGVAYILSLVAIFGIVPNDVLTSTAGEASFSVAFTDIFGGEWAGKMMSAFAVISGIGALNAWTMICAEMPQAAADDELFPRIFAKVSKAGVPIWGIVISTILASVFTIFAYATQAGIEVLNTLVLLTGVTAAIPYFFSANAQLYYLLTQGKAANPKTFSRDMVIAIAALLFSFWFVYGSGPQATFWAYLLILASYVLLIVIYARRRKAGEIIQGDQSQNPS
ncbi:MAG: amino acid permease [Candidatus Nanopelagicales bacterium]|nr:amino acid permease [Candidatus Nanopelagicales bacterium]MDZ4250388.1 amino acid permease [Candidatus Nanopelagicales bacterium]